ncbi:MAG: hypothetical protein M3R38_12270 [Actinomycetota bacterium]|nr:hypothetical protein [Actinomycetota bacterium]
MNEYNSLSNEIPLPETPDKHSTKHLVVDASFAAILSADFGIPTVTILDALKGEPKKASIGICEWASCTDDPAYALRCWARRHGRGAYRASSVAQSGGRSNTRGDGRASGPAPERSIARRRFCVLDPARVRANVARMAG